MVKELTKLELFKGATKFVVSVGVGAIVSNAVAFTTPVLAVGVLKKAAIGVGSLVLSAMISDKATDYTDEKIDEIVEEAKKLSEEEKNKEVKDGV